MGYTTTVTAHQKKWVAVECQACDLKYSCFVEAHGQQSDGLLPLGEESLKEIALHDLDSNLRKKAEAIPCPRCGSFPQAHVERRLKTVRAIVHWALAPVVFFVLFALIAFTVPKAPVWWLIVVLAVSLVVPRLFSGYVADKFHPNNDLEKNRQAALAKLRSDDMRLQPKQTGSAAAAAQPAGAAAKKKPMP